MARALCAAVLLGLAVRPASAAVSVSADGPFTAAELEIALAARGLDGDIRVAVQCEPGDVVRVDTDSGERRVALAGARGMAAARLVALHLLEDSLGDLRAAPALPPPDIAHRPDHRADHRLDLTLAAGLGHGIEGKDLALTAIDVGVDGVHGWWRWTAGVVWLHGLARGDAPRAPVGADMGFVRAGVGPGWGPIDAAVGAIAGAHRVDGAATGALLGAEARIRIRLARVGRWAAHAGVEADLFQHRAIARYDGEAFAATPRVSVRAQLALAWGVAP